jgi:hypothetical protein
MAAATTNSTSAHRAKKFAKKATLDPAVYPFFYTGHRVVT